MLFQHSAFREVKKELRASVLWPLRLPHIFKGYRRPPKTFLLIGPPGTGKTMLVEKVSRGEGRINSNLNTNSANMKVLRSHQVAAESRSVLLAVTPSAVLSKWSGESEKTIRDIFAAADEARI